MHNLKFQGSLDMQIFALEENLAQTNNLGGVTSESINESITEENIEERRKRKKRIVDREKSKILKKAWRTRRASFMKGIKKFHKSLKGKRLHQKVAQRKKMGKYRNVQEAYVNLSSVLTHLAIQTQYSSSISEEADAELLLASGHDLLTPILESLISGVELDEFNESFNDSEAALFLDDIMGLSDLMHESFEDLGSEAGVEEAADPKGTEDPKAKDSADNNNPVKRAKEAESEDAEIEKTVDRLLNDDSDDVEESINDLMEPDETKIDESLQGNTEFKIDEAYGTSSGKVDGEHVIAYVEGPAFFPDTVSRNKVEYSREFWESVLSNPDLQRELESRRVYGTVGHDLEINDEAIRDGMISHIVDRVWINEQGIGRGGYLILNTEPGRTLRTLLGAGSKVRVSTRGRGRYLTKRNSRGNKVPDPKGFRLAGVDFVHDPGYLAAQPENVDLN